MAVALDTLADARRLREAGFSEAQAEGHAEALAAAMTDTLVTKQEFRELEIRMGASFAAVKENMREMEMRIDARFEYLERHLSTRLDEHEKRIDVRFAEQDRRIESRFAEQDARLDAKLADLERRMTTRLGTVTVAAIGAVSAIVRLL